jgi:hypothetical protein
MWDQDASGYGRGEGVAAVVLKRLSTAIADGDHIECIIKESGVNQDGRTKGITMPSSIAQANLIARTYARAGLDPRSPDDRCNGDTSWRSARSGSNKLLLLYAWRDCCRSKPPSTIRWLDQNRVWTYGRYCGTGRSYQDFACPPTRYHPAQLWLQKTFSSRRAILHELEDSGIRSSLA